MLLTGTSARGAVGEREHQLPMGSAARLSTSQSQQAAPVKARQRALLLDLESTGVDPKVAKIITEILSVRLSRMGTLEIISSNDVQSMLDVEGQRQSLGCDELAQSCLAELGAAMGAELIVTGTVGGLGRLYIVTLRVLDTARAKALARVEFQSVDLEEMPNKLDAAVERLLRDTGHWVESAAPVNGNASPSQSVPVSEETVNAGQAANEVPTSAAALEGNSARANRKTTATMTDNTQLWQWGLIGLGGLTVAAGGVCIAVGIPPVLVYLGAVDQYQKAERDGATLERRRTLYQAAAAANASATTLGLPLVVTGGIAALVGAAVAGGTFWMASE